MRLFQNSGISPSYRKRLHKINLQNSGFSARRQAFLDDGNGICHFLLPVMENRPEAFFTNGDDPGIQREWARENGLPEATPLAEILIAQIEHHRTEVFYNSDPILFGGDFNKKLPGCVKHTICWRAAPSQGLNLNGFDLLVCNFPSILKSYSEAGLRSAYFAPAHDEILNPYADRSDRPIDILFVGGYSRHHAARAKVLEAVAGLAGQYKVLFALDRSRVTRLAESPIGHVLPLAKHRRPASVREVSSDPVFGRVLYTLMAQSKIVLNGAVDMAGRDRGNMRCFEALGCGSLMVSDQGIYPEGFYDGETMLCYQDPQDAVAKLGEVLSQWDHGRKLAKAGTDMVKINYSKQSQWGKFQRLVESI